MRGTTKSELTNHTENVNSNRKASIKSQSHMNDNIKVEEFKAKNPLDYRFR